MMLNACVYIDTVYEVMLAQSTCCDRCKINKRHTSKGTKKVIICNAESPVTMSYM